MIVRSGLGYDVHRLVEGRALVVGGVILPHKKGSLGHSDGDALIHAIVDALLGALALGDIGTHFPDSDPRWKDAPSRIFLEEASQQVRKEGYEIGNVDTTVILERPRLRPHIAAIRQNLASIMGIRTEQISVKATTHEKMGFLGEEKGWACQAIVTLVKNENER